MRADGATRTNIKLVDSDATTDINLPGLTATGELLTEAEATLLTLAEPGALVVLAGSLPLGCPPDHYGRLIARLQSRACARCWTPAAMRWPMRWPARPALGHQAQPRRTGRMGGPAATRSGTSPRKRNGCANRAWDWWRYRWASKAPCSPRSMACCMRSCQPPPWPAPSARATSRAASRPNSGYRARGAPGGRLRRRQARAGRPSP